MGASENLGIPADVKRRKVILPGKEIEIALQDWGGEGPLALLHHANGFCAALWAPVAEQLRSQFHVVAMDARGHGDSGMPQEGATPESFSWALMADDLGQVAHVLLEETGESQIALGLGHSFGGTLTLAAESQHPGLYERLVLVDPVIPSTAWATPERIESQSGMVERARRRRSRWASHAEAHDQLSTKSLFANWTPSAFDLYIQEGLLEGENGEVALKCPGEVEAQIFGNSLSLNLDEVLAGVRTPARLLWARHGIFPREVFERVCAVLPGAQLVEADAGHLIPMEKPDWVVENVLDFCSLA